MTLVTGDENREGEAIGCNCFWRGRRRGGSMVPKADNTVKSGEAIGEVEDNS
jgi:hypothetical protein